MHYSSKLVGILLNLLVSMAYALPTAGAANVSTVEARQATPYTGLTSKVYLCTGDNWTGYCEHMDIHIQSCVPIPAALYVKSLTTHPNCTGLDADTPSTNSAYNVHSIGTDRGPPYASCILQS
ncbi:hypothetical protein LTR37_007397 [Vermiconidia calcicola]|uniref:Uncharacterized protein n=1 Tax=Vermiconidia calcicola TaxID=1690605 RepID=A0ACC3NDU7_9PEZI|nr:hypothetical protein LTR37_007397 [Vermiconidia calcicola]